ncbi:MAG: SirA family protein [Deltaproteobacteria bacterium]|nr:SirA family protein [Deltaproteobacteria bacterium]
MTSSSPSSLPPVRSSPGEPGSTLDLCGEVCPFTFVRTKLALEALPIGATLRVVVDHEPAVKNLPRSAAEWGQEVLGAARLPDVGSSHGPRWAIDLRKRVR